MVLDLSAPPFTLDVRVATSPMVGLRYAVDGRATDIDDLVGRLEQAHREAAAERDDVRNRLKPYDVNHRAIIERLTRGSRGQYRQRLDESLALRTELARLDERLVCLRERMSALREERASLRRLKTMLARIHSLDKVAIDGPGAAANQAVRQLFQLIDVDHETTAQHIFEGPMQHLADAALQTELIGRSVRADNPSAVESAASIRRATDAALRELQHVVFALHPQDLRTTGLVPALRRLAAGLAPRAAVRIIVIGRTRRLAHSVEVALFRIVQEALANAVVHGHANHVEVTLHFQPARVSIVVLDDGEGFDVAATEARLGRGGGLGLLTMRQRAAMEGGQLEVRSLVGAGTEVRTMVATQPV